MNISEFFSNRIEETIDDNVSMINLVKGVLEDGRNYYAYIKIKPSKYLEFQIASQKGDCDISEYGEIILHGEGEPTDAIKKEMKEKYGCEEDFEENAKKFFENYKQTLQTHF